MKARTIIMMDTEVAEEDKELARAIHNNQKRIEQAKKVILEAAEDLFGEDGMTIRVETELIEEEST